MSGIIDSEECEGESPPGVVFPSVGIADVTAIETIIGTTLDAGQRRLLTAGGALVVSSNTLGERAALDLVRLPRRSAGDDPRRLVEIASLPALSVAALPQYVDVPVAFMLPATAAEVGVGGGRQGADVLMQRKVGTVEGAPAEESVSVELIRNALPVGRQAQADIRLAAGLDAVDDLRTAFSTLLVGTVLVAATVIASGVALWGAETRSELSRLAVVGARRRWMLGVGFAHGGMISALACAVGIVPGVVFGALFLCSVGIDVSIPADAVVVMMASILAVAATTGAVSTPRGGNLLRPQV